ncbi:MAG: anaerobic benzoate catabolism transcriptional regulator [Acidobacteria bacterium ADurb.Bin340]|nr:MAG: anaerobic benzoate catabolism transcriptional regulator [Acidobacteria bacterium ADurb.Bin340]HOD32851.1 XRE family transcriptional regulator [Holophaga sp.]HQL47806.1 XRE family transcriptional regulator [Holophaga sp.]
MPFDPKHLLQTVAAKLLQKRRELNWSQQDLADRSQVSRRMIGMIESGESNVSLATLGHLAAALGITFSELVESAEATETGEGVRPKRGLQLWQGSRTGTKVDLLQSFPASRSVELWKWTIAPGDRYEGEPDLPGYREMLYVIRGSLFLEREEGTQRLKAGDAIAFPSDRPYAFVNNGKVNLVFVLNVVA